MRLSPTTELRLNGSGRATRLSYVFEDDDGGRVGLTSAWLADAEAPGSADGRERAGGRPCVWADGSVVGRLDPPGGGERDAEPGEGYVGAGALTCTFLVLPGVPLDPAFRKQATGRVVPLEAVAGIEVHAFGEEEPAGRVLPGLEFTVADGKTVYPLLGIERYPDDFKGDGRRLRNGAMAVTKSGELVGVIVGVTEDMSNYSLAPIADVMRWHGLNFMRESEDRPEDLEAGSPEDPWADPPADDLPDNLDPELCALIAG